MAAKKSYPRSKIRPYTVAHPCWLEERRRRDPKSKDGAASDNEAAVERREAQRPGGEPRKLVTAGRARLGMGLANLSARRVRQPE
jgi:hypothetical protein